MFMTARKARQVLVRDGVSTWSADCVLRAGLAGEPVATQTGVLYDAARVRELAQRPTVRWTDLAAECPAGFFVARRDFPATGSREDQVASLSPGWGSVNPWRWVAMQQQIELHGSLPFVATVGGLVVLGADIVETRGCSRLVLERPGAWFEGLAGCWFPTGRGRPWVLHLGPVRPAKMAA